MTSAPGPMKVIGLMSGTSLDGIDAVLAEFGGDSVAQLEWRVLGFVSQPYSLERRNTIHRAILEGSAESMARVHALLGEWFAEAARLLDESGGRVKVGIVMARLGVDAGEAVRRLEAAGGLISRVVGELGPV